MEATMKKKVGFFDPVSDKLVEVEDWDLDRSGTMSTVFKMKALYASKRHRLPSAVWCVWDHENISIFTLDTDCPSEEMLNRAKAAIELQP